MRSYAFQTAARGLFRMRLFQQLILRRVAKRGLEGRTILCGSIMTASQMALRAEIFPHSLL
jgi:hypothetical protein